MATGKQRQEEVRDKIESTKACLQWLPSSNKVLTSRVSITYQYSIQLWIHQWINLLTRSVPSWFIHFLNDQLWTSHWGPNLQHMILQGTFHIQITMEALKKGLEGIGSFPFLAFSTWEHSILRRQQ
jgi:hypothetical protein